MRMRKSRKGKKERKKEVEERARLPSSSLNSTICAPRISKPHLEQFVGQCELELVTATT